MIHPIQVPTHQAEGPVAHDAPDGAVVPIDEMVRQFAVQQFVQALMGGDRELTGIPDLTDQDG